MVLGKLESADSKITHDTKVLIILLMYISLLIIGIIILLLYILSYLEDTNFYSTLWAVGMLIIFAQGVYLSVKIDRIAKKWGF